MTPQLVIPLGEAQLDLQEHFAAGQALFEKQIGSWEEFHSTEDAFTRWDEDSRNLLHSFTEDDSLIDVYDNVSFAAGMLGRDLVLIEEIASLRKNISERLEQFDEIRKGLPRLPQAGNGA